MNNRYNASIEICGSLNKALDITIPGFVTGIPDTNQFTPALLEPYFLVNSDHKGAVNDVRGLFKYLVLNNTGQYSHTFSQFNIKIDTQQSIDQIKFIPSFVPPYLLNDPKTTVTPNTQIII